jgi:hypothetical protein
MATQQTVTFTYTEGLEIEVSLTDLRAALIHDRRIAAEEGFRGVAARAAGVLRDIDAAVQATESAGKIAHATIMIKGSRLS